MKNIILTGFMGTGKSSVGKVLAAKIGYGYCDLDDLIIKHAEISINEIFEKFGEKYFRELETNMIKQVSLVENMVIATGGGAVIKEDNRQLLHSSGVIVNLEASVEQICSRLSNDATRPLLKDRKSLEQVKEMLKEREPYYADADIRIDTTGKKVEYVVDEILCRLKGKLDLETLKVDLGERSYDIVFGVDVIARLGSLCRSLALGEKVMIITNPTVAGHYFETARKSLAEAGYKVNKIIIPDGESYKNYETLQKIYDALIEAGMDRGGFIVALGGGVIGDISGFAAATYLRGISFVQVPTTLLAQVDSSVGGKTGINHAKGKNLIGSFYQPKLVCVDVKTLETLPEREYISGLSEVIKYGVIADGEFFDFIFDNRAKLLARDKACLLTVEKRSCAIKASVVMKDERESGLRAILNFGHTIGHAIESLSEYKKYLHGEAVAIGMAHAAIISEAMGYSTKSDTDRIVNLLESLHLPVKLPDYRAEAYASAILHDKKVKDGCITLVLNKGVGHYSLVKITDLNAVLKKCGIGD